MRWIAGDGHSEQCGARALHRLQIDPVAPCADVDLCPPTPRPAVALTLAIPALLSLLYGGLPNVWRSLASLLMSRAFTIYLVGDRGTHHAEPVAAKLAFHDRTGRCHLLSPCGAFATIGRVAHTGRSACAASQSVLHPVVCHLDSAACLLAGGWPGCSFLSALAALLLWESTRGGAPGSRMLSTRALVIVPPLAAWLWQAERQQLLSARP
jgi:hypothetical protein